LVFDPISFPLKENLFLLVRRINPNFFLEKKGLR
jgi:hypothetical protein